ncbi:Protein of unknown function DUF247 [Macleaya cordata]|uniref:Uncharacterized protein n=1 Tax=Macleaya cordata TaxID=56857 RepID=A0A200PM28_MACCD|nr:Protein of unknown function DUF247 [Macleaya cordata]
MARGSRHQKKDPIEEERNRRKKLKRVMSDEQHQPNKYLLDPLKVLQDSLLGQWAIDIDNFVKEGGPQHRQRKSSSAANCTLFRVPANMRELNMSAYSPKLVSIGPFYNNDGRFHAMEEHKMRYLLGILARFNEQGRVIVLDLFQEQENPLKKEYTNIEKLVLLMTSLEKETRKCYSESFDYFPSHEFVMMMLLDGCFVIELLRLYNKFFGYEEIQDPIFEARWMLPILQRDLFMLENQLPFFVLERLFKLTSLDEKETPLVELTLKFFDSLLPREMKLLKEKFSKMADKDHDHLLGLFRSSFTSTLKSKQEHPSSVSAGSSNNRNNGTKMTVITVDGETEVTPQEERRLVHAVTELLEAGVKFKKRTDWDLLDIAFVNGVFQIPPLIVDDYTIPFFLNMVAYEQCCPYRDPYFTDYVLFFDSLVNSPKDVEILHYEGIIEHVMGSDEVVANLFNKLCREVVYDVDGCYLSQHLKQVNRYTERKWNLWRAKLMHDYFNSPWAFISLMAAIILLWLTIAQTLFAFLSYFNPPKAT